MKPNEPHPAADICWGCFKETTNREVWTMRAIGGNCPVCSVQCKAKLEGMEIGNFSKHCELLFKAIVRMGRRKNNPRR